MTVRRLLLLISAFTLALAGCGKTPDILGTVKAGTLLGTTKKIGKAFDDAFPGGTWDASTSAMGETGEMIAEFRSTTTAAVLEASGFPKMDRKDCMDGVQSPCRTRVSFQFILAPDSKTITLAEVKAPEPVKSGEELTALLGFVYR